MLANDALRLSIFWFGLCKMQMLCSPSRKIKHLKNYMFFYFYILTSMWCYSFYSQTWTLIKFLPTVIRIYYNKIVMISVNMRFLQILCDLSGGIILVLGKAADSDIAATAFMQIARYMMMMIVMMLLMLMTRCHIQCI